MSYLTDWMARERFRNSLRPRWQLIMSLLGFATFSIMWAVILCHAWQGRMIGSRWEWMTSSIVWMLASLCRIAFLFQALRKSSHGQRLSD